MTIITVFFRQRNRNPQQLNIYIDDSYLEIQGKNPTKNSLLWSQGNWNVSRLLWFCPTFSWGREEIQETVFCALFKSTWCQGRGLVIAFLFTDLPFLRILTPDPTQLCLDVVDKEWNSVLILPAEPNPWVTNETTSSSLTFSKSQTHTLFYFCFWS